MVGQKRSVALKGFTLIELLLVVMVIAILAALVFTRIFIARQRANESNVRGNLRELRRAVKMFEADMGAYPVELDDVCTVTPPEQGLVSQGDSVATIALTADQKKNFKGPYYEYPSHTLPVNLLTHGNAEGTDWIYEKGTPADLGWVKNGTPGNDSTGVPYSEW